VQVRLLTRVSEIPAEEWNALAGEYPFLRHEFLAAMEDSGCASARSGWRPRHLLLSDQRGLAAAAPLYEKSHSWGEFVFDFAWARAAEQAGMAYYPKLVCAVPFTRMDDTSVTLPSPGETTAPAKAGTTLSGSRKNHKKNNASRHAGSAHTGPASQPMSTAAPASASA